MAALSPAAVLTSSEAYGTLVLTLTGAVDRLPSLLSGMPTAMRQQPMLPGNVSVLLTACCVPVVAFLMAHSS